jgi:uracil-DNA glycosylase
MRSVARRPKNKPEASEIATCRQFLAAEITGMLQLRVILALGVIAHYTVVAALGLRRRLFPFAHSRLHALPSKLVLADSYHCSRLNITTGKLSVSLFESVFVTLTRCVDAFVPGGPEPV